LRYPPAPHPSSGHRAPLAWSATGRQATGEEVTFAIRPPDFEDAVIASVSWTVLHLGDKLAEMADAMVRTIHVTPLR
jgi:hypothetical protein